MKSAFHIIIVVTLLLLTTSSFAFDIPATNNRVLRDAMLVRSGVLYIGGEFTEVGGLKRNRVAAIDLDNGKVMDWDPGLDSDKDFAVTGIVEYAGIIYLGGSFKTVAGKDIPGLVAVVNARAGRGEAYSAWVPRPDKTVLGMTLGGDHHLYVVGRFTEMGATPRGRGAALSLVNENKPVSMTDWDPKADDWITSVVQDPSNPGYLYIGGIFKNLNGQKRELFARVARDSGQVDSFDIDMMGTASRQVLRMIEHRGRLYVAGVEFEQVQGKKRHNLFSLDTFTGQVTEFDTNVNAGVGALTAAGDKIFIGGDFTVLNGEASISVAALDWLSGAATALQIKADRPTYALLAHGSELFMSGYWHNFLAVMRTPWGISPQMLLSLR